MPTTFFDDVIFPLHVSQGTAGGPDWPAEIVELSSGLEERNTHLSAPLRSYDARFGVRTPAELYEVLELYHVAHGRLYGFRLQDWTDYRSGPPHRTPAFDDQAFAVGNGVATQFQLRKRYASGSHEFWRDITRPFGQITIGVNGAPLGGGFTVAMSTGIVTFAAPPANGATISWGGQFHVPVRFDCRLDQVSLRSAAIGDIPSILLKELRR